MNGIWKDPVTTVIAIIILFCVLYFVMTGQLNPDNTGDFVTTLVGALTGLGLLLAGSKKETPKEPPK